MNQRPETGIVQVIDVTICLAPAQVVPEILIGRIEYNAAVKDRWVLEGRVWEEGRPMKHVRRSKI